MTNKNLGLVVARKLSFVLAAILFLISNFLPLFAVSKTSSSIYAGVSFWSLTNVFSYYFLLVAFVVGFVLVVFSDKKYFAIGSGLHLVSPIACLISFLNIITSTMQSSSSSTSTIATTSSSTTLRVGIGAILMLVAIVLYVVSYICFAVNCLLNKELNDNNIDKRVELVKSYKQWKEEGIISEEEYLEKKNEILQLNSKKDSKK